MRVAERRARRDLDGQPPAGGVRRRLDAAPGRGERPRRARAPVVAGSYLEDQDMWWLSGIFRAVTLLLRPAGAIDDLFVHADYDHVTGAGRLRVDAAGAGAGERARAGPRSRGRRDRPRSSASSRGARSSRGCTTPR